MSNLALERALTEIQFTISQCRPDPEMVIARYGAGILGHYQIWTSYTLPWVRDEKARYILTENIRQEMQDNHIQLLSDFIDGSGVTITNDAKNAVKETIAKIYESFSNVTLAGLGGIALLTLLENALIVGIPTLGRCGEALNCDKMAYIRVHNAANKARAEALREALEREYKLGYSVADRTKMDYMIMLGTRLMRTIFRDNTQTATS